MTGNLFNIKTKPINILGTPKKQESKKRKILTPAKRIYIWERPNIYGRTCSICHRRITKLSDLEFDHTRAYSKGGTKLALAHKDCNRLKSSGSLVEIQKSLGIKTKTRKRKSTKKKSKGDYWINPITGRKEKRPQPLFRL